ARGVAVQADGKVLVAGPARGGAGPSGDFALARYLATGALDPAFGAGGRGTAAFDGPRLAHARLGHPPGTGVAPAARGRRFRLGPSLADGRPDDTFGGGGRVSFNFPIGLIGGTAVAYAVALQPDGKIVAAGGCGSNPVLARLNADGTLDAGFGAGGKVGDCNTA